MEENRMEPQKEKKTFPRTCDYCSKIFNYQSALIKHERIHTKEKPFACDIEGCNQRFTQVSNLLRHKKDHAGIKPFECKKCHKKCSSLSNLSQHMGVHQQKRKRYKYTCFVRDCTTSYLYTCTLKKHLKKAHEEELEQIQAKFKNINFMQVYKQLHEEEAASQFDFVRIKNEDDDSSLYLDVEGEIKEIKEKRKKKNSSMTNTLVVDRPINLQLLNWSGLRLAKRRKIKKTEKLKIQMFKTTINESELPLGVNKPVETVKFKNKVKLINSQTVRKSRFTKAFSIIKKSLKGNSQMVNFEKELIMLICKFLNYKYSVLNENAKLINLMQLEKEYFNSDRKNFSKLIELLAESLFEDKKGMDLINSLFNSANYESMGVASNSITGNIGKVAGFGQLPYNLGFFSDKPSNLNQIFMYNLFSNGHTSNSNNNFHNTQNLNNLVFNQTNFNQTTNNSVNNNSYLVQLLLSLAQVKTE